MWMQYFFRLFTSLALVLCGICSSAQNYPVYNSFYINPFLYNPAEAATNFTYVYAHHRQQWMGVDGSPVLTAVTMNTLLNDTKAGIGGKISNYKRGLLSTTDVSASYAYGIPVNKKNWFFFGLSGGVITTTIDLSQVTDPSDPVLAAYQANNIQPTANFGMLFRTAGGLNFGVSLPQLFTPTFNGSTFSGTGVSPTDNIFVTLYYKRKVEGKIVNKRKGGMRSRVKTKESTAPLELYLNYKYAALGNSQFEVLAKLNVSENFWLGASYKMPYGFTGNIGLNYQRFLIGYSYEPNNQPESGFSQGTHEVTLGLRLGEQKKFKKTAVVLRSTLATNPAERHTARFNENVEDPDNISREETTKRKYYVVIRSFADFTQADAFKKKLIEQKFNANVFYNEKDRKYHVHVLETTKSGEANEEVKNLKNYTKLKEARVLVVETKEKK
jgi:type IX secretion system PorP/SprF family membrane protein